MVNGVDSAPCKAKGNSADSIHCADTATSSNGRGITNPTRVESKHAASMVRDVAAAACAGTQHAVRRNRNTDANTCIEVKYVASEAQGEASLEFLNTFFTLRDAASSKNDRSGTTACPAFF